MPSRDSLNSIARVLEQRLSYFLERPFDDDDIIQPHERLSFRGLDNGITIEMLSRGFRKCCAIGISVSTSWLSF